MQNAECRMQNALQDPESFQDERAECRVANAEFSAQRPHGRFIVVSFCIHHSSLCISITARLGSRTLEGMADCLVRLKCRLLPVAWFYEGL